MHRGGLNLFPGPQEEEKKTHETILSISELEDTGSQAVKKNFF